MTLHLNTEYRRVLALTVIISLFSIIANAQIYQGLSVAQSDSLINANVDNPNFVILDVRTPGEYNPQHLEGAINRNFYDSDFEAQLDALDKDKMYLIHCASGGRSGVTLGKMETLNFAQVYDMLGGMNAWNAGGYPTTAEFAPRLMLVSDSDLPNEEVFIGMIDTIEVTITNRANSVLSFTSVTDLSGTEFTTDFDANTTLEGAEDYSFHIFYSPTDEFQDELTFSIESNGGSTAISITRTGKMILATRLPDISSNIRLFPNPATDGFQLAGLNTDKVKVDIIRADGEKVKTIPFSGQNDKIEVSKLKAGTYFIQITTPNGMGTLTFVKN